jgi:hypothetical protein
MFVAFSDVFLLREEIPKCPAAGCHLFRSTEGVDTKGIRVY